MATKIKNDSKEYLGALYIQSLLLAKVVERMLKQKGRIDLSSKPSLEKKPIVEFMKRMRIGTGVEKFDSAAYISVVNFFISEDDMRLNKTLGAVILYVHEDYIVELFKKMGYPDLDEDNQDELEDACGTLCNLIAAKFKAGLLQLGYSEITMSHFTSYRNEVLNGVDYDTSEKEKYEITIEVQGRRRIILGLTMGMIPESLK